MIVYELPNGDLEVPRRAEGNDMIGDGIERIGPDHVEYASWRDAITRGFVDLVPVDDAAA